MKIKVWCDSGANIDSRREDTIDTNDFGFTDEEWLALDEDDQMEVVRDWANDRLEMGWAPVE